MTKEDIKTLIADAAFDCEGGWQPEELRRKNAAHIADAILIKLDGAGVLKVKKL